MHGKRQGDILTDAGFTGAIHNRLPPAAMPSDFSSASDPLRTELAALAPLTTLEQRAVRTDEPDASGHVLVVDDEADMRAYLRSCLEPRWEVDEAADGTSAIAQATETPPLLVVADMRMPRMDGAALTRALKAETETRDIPVLLISGQRSQPDVGDGFLAKPFTCSRLRAVVCRLAGDPA